MNMSFRRTILFWLCLFFVHVTIAQDAPAIKSSVNKTQVLLGQPFELTVEAYLPAGFAAKFPAIDTIDHFELLEKPAIDSSSKSGGVEIKAVYKITSFDSGHWVIPQFSLSESIRSDSIPVDVVFTSPFDPNKEYHDIKDVTDVEIPKKKQDWWWYVAGGALLLAFILWQVLKKKPAPVIAPVAKATVNAYEEAMRQLEKLSAEKPDIKQYYSRLTDIFRLYVFRKKGILSLQKTTDDLIIQVKEVIPGKEQFDKLSQSLRLSDFVKFAKYMPAEEDNSNALNEIKNAITAIEKSSAATVQVTGK